MRNLPVERRSINEEIDEEERTLFLISRFSVISTGEAIKDRGARAPQNDVTGNDAKVAEVRITKAMTRVDDVQNNLAQRTTRVDGMCGRSKNGSESGTLEGTEDQDWHFHRTELLHTPLLFDLTHSFSVYGNQQSS